MNSKLILVIIVAGVMSALACNVQAANMVVVIPLFSASGNATAADVLSGKTFSNATAKGITGTRTPAPLEVTGQSTCYDAAGTVIACAGTGQDGDKNKGATVSTRFADNADGTVTDNLTGLVWLKNAACTDMGTLSSGKDTWAKALTAANGLFDDTAGDCNLSDGSVAGDWRLPNLFELESLRDMGQNSPPLASGHPFTGVVASGGPDSYWSSTSVASTPAKAWVVGFMDGIALYDLKTVNTYYIWPVRDSK